MATLLKKLINAKKTSTKLAILAEAILTYKDFDQERNERCVIGYGTSLMGFKFPSTSTFNFVKTFGVTMDEADMLLLANYDNLEIGECNMGLKQVTPEVANRVLLKLAGKYEEQGQ